MPDDPKLTPGPAKVVRLRGRKWQETRKFILTHEPLCRMCAAVGKRTKAYQIDHVTPLSEGGTNEPDNLQPLCIPCHVAKTSKRYGYDVNGFPLDPNHHWNK